MLTFRDFLVLYNNLNVVPFIEAIDKQCTIFKKKKRYMLKSAVCLPRLAARCLVSVRKDSTDSTTLLKYYQNVRYSILQVSPVTPLDDTKSEISQRFIGGPSIMFHRYHKKCILGTQPRLALKY